MLNFIVIKRTKGLIKKTILKWTFLFETTIHSDTDRGGPFSILFKLSSWDVMMVGSLMLFNSYSINNCPWIAQSYFSLVFERPNFTITFWFWVHFTFRWHLWKSKHSYSLAFQKTSETRMMITVLHLDQAEFQTWFSGYSCNCIYVNVLIN